MSWKQIPVLLSSWECQMAYDLGAGTVSGCKLAFQVFLHCSPLCLNASNFVVIHWLSLKLFFGCTRCCGLWARHSCMIQSLESLLPQPWPSEWSLSTAHFVYTVLNNILLQVLCHAEFLCHGRVAQYDSAFLQWRIHPVLPLQMSL